MLDGIDWDQDPIGLVTHEEFVCGTCRHVMMPISQARYQCPHCGMVFNDDFMDLA